MSLNNSKKKKFIQKSEYPGGIEGLRSFIKNNLKYPQKALENKIEGNVLVKYKVNSIGEIFNIQIIQGLGFGCDEEAIRIIKKLKYPKLLNRKIKVTTNKKISIKFRLPKRRDNIVINYQIIK
ncbi:MAG: hypothetical protein CMP54_01810 [Flavobacteriales bacterium]|nr:hypothetical protein [Flavobacteriales bacterium]|tara:strand:- start:128 stop:496 length:369 start_codon:yes stop_codon:yes gene_type:complete